METALLGAIEGGGTKFVCAVGTSATPAINIIESVVLPTSTPQETLTACAEFFVAAAKKHGRIAAFGFGCFGPLDLRIGSPTFGHMLATPKPDWSRASLIAPLRARFGESIAISLDTDVGAAGLAELQLGAGRGLGSIGYVTVGTGIGAAVAPDDNAQRRLMHAEMGHIMVRRDPRDLFPGMCPFHGDCLEGLASGPAIKARWGCDLSDLSSEHPAWSIIGGYLGQLASTMALMLSVERLVFGGGVMANGLLLPHIRAAVNAGLNKYLQPLGDPRAVERYIVLPELGTRAGISGAFLLAKSAV